MPLIDNEDFATLRARIAELEQKLADEEMLSPAQVAEALHVSSEYIRNLIRRGELEASKIGQWRISRGNLRKFVELRSSARAGVQQGIMCPVCHFLSAYISGDKSCGHCGAVWREVNGRPFILNSVEKG